MKKRTIYLPEWLDAALEGEAKEDLRSFSSQVLYHLTKQFYFCDPAYKPTPYFTEGGVTTRDEPKVWL
jgi:hypothetical protein